ncbi:g6228 [Coccomyxa elongata]
MEEAQEQASPDEGESDYHVSEVLAAEARAASERAEGERLAQIAEENNVPLILSSELWEDAGLSRGRSLRSLIIAAVHKQAPIDEPVLRVALADFASAIQELMKRVQSLEVNLHAANNLVETLRREVAVLKNRFSGRPGVISPETIRTLMSVTSKFSGGSAEDFETWSKQFERGCAMLNLDPTQYVKVAEMQLEGKALLRWH